MRNAVKFLSHSKIRASPVIYQRSFLERKGLTKEEIDEAFQRVPDPTSYNTNDPIGSTNSFSLDAYDFCCRIAHCNGCWCWCVVQECSLDTTVISEANETEQKKDLDCSSAHTNYQTALPLQRLLFSTYKVPVMIFILQMTFWMIRLKVRYTEVTLLS